MIQMPLTWHVSSSKCTIPKNIKLLQPRHNVKKERIINTKKHLSYLVARQANATKYKRHIDIHAVSTDSVIEDTLRQQHKAINDHYFKGHILILVHVRTISKHIKTISILSFLYRNHFVEMFPLLQCISGYLTAQLSASGNIKETCSLLTKPPCFPSSQPYLVRS